MSINSLLEVRDVTFNTEIGIALKGYEGQYDIKTLTVFEIERINRRFASLEAKLDRNKNVKVKARCPLCGEYHQYYYSINDFLKRDMVIGGCEKLGMPIFYIGNKGKVSERINQFNEARRNIYAMI